MEKWDSLMEMMETHISLENLTLEVTTPNLKNTQVLVFTLKIGLTNPKVKLNQMQ